MTFTLRIYSIIFFFFVILYCSILYSKKASFSFHCTCTVTIIISYWIYLFYFIFLDYFFKSFN